VKRYIKSAITNIFDEDPEVREQVAKDPRTPADVLVKLADDDSGYVRSYVAENPNTPVDVLKQLACDLSQGVRGSVAMNPNASDQILKVLTKDWDSWVRLMAVRHVRDKNLLAQLAEDEDPDIRYNVAYNLNTPLDILLRLQYDEDEDTKLQALSSLRDLGYTGD